MKMILNEQEIVDKALKNKEYDYKKPTSTIRVLIKHYYNIGQNSVQVRDSIEDFMTKNYKGYDKVKWQDILDKMVENFNNKNNTLFVLQDVRITQSELDTIQSINNLRLEKLAFVLLVYAKIYNKLNKKTDGWVNSEFRDIYSDTKMAVNSIDQCKMMYKLKELKLIEFSKKVDCTNTRVMFLNENSDVIITISNFKNFVYEYLKFKGDKIGVCEICCCLIKIKSNRQTMCNECAREINIKKTIENRKNKKLFEIEKSENA